MSEKSFPKVKIEWKPKKSRISQIYSEGLEYAFVSKDNKQISQLVYCKDFLQDSIYGFLNKQYVQIYSFVYDHLSDSPICLDETKVVIANCKDKTLRSKIANCLSFMHQIEDIFKMKKTQVFEGEDAPSMYKKSGIWLFRGSKRWMSSPPMISMYSLLLRVGLLHDGKVDFRKTISLLIDGFIKPYQEHDKDQIKVAVSGMNYILKHGDRKLFSSDIKRNYTNNICLSDMHNDAGIVGYSCKSLAYTMPHWYKMGELNKTAKNIL